MADNNDYSLGQLRFSEWSAPTTAGTEAIRFNVFAGKLSVGLHKRTPGSNGAPPNTDFRPFWEYKFTPLAEIAFREIIKTALNSPAGHTEKIGVPGKYDPATKTRALEAWLVIAKDSDSIYHLGIRTKEGATYDVVLNGSALAGFQLNDGPYQDVVKSRMHLQWLEEWLTVQCPQFKILSNRKWQGPAGGAPNNTVGGAPAGSDSVPW